MFLEGKNRQRTSSKCIGFCKITKGHAMIIAHAVKPPPFEQLAGVPLPLIDLLRRMLAKSREHRPQNPRQLQEEIETVITNLAAEFSPSTRQIAPASPPLA